MEKVIMGIVEKIDNTDTIDPTITLHDFGKLGVDIVVSAEKDEFLDETYYKVEIFAPQDYNDIRCDDVRVLGNVGDCTKTELIDALKEIAEGDCIISAYIGLDQKNVNLKDAIKEYNKESKKTICTER